MVGRTLPEDASYYDRVKLGELVVGELERRREGDAADVYERLEAIAHACSTSVVMTSSDRSAT